MIAEKRYCELRAAGRILQGDAVVYGDRAVFPWGEEIIAPGAFAPLGDVILNRQHDRKTPLARTGGGGLSLHDTATALAVRAELPDTPSANETLALVRGKILRGLSVEFLATAERQAGDMRIIEKAQLVGVGVVDDPQYPKSLVQARAKELRARSGRTLRATIPEGVKLACMCSGGAEVKFAQFAENAISEMLDNAFSNVQAELGNPVIAAFENYQSPLASARRGTVRRAARNAVDIDLPKSAAGDAVLSAAEDAGVIVRPFIDAAESVFVTEGDTAVYSRARLRAVLISSTDQRSGWPTPQLIETTEAVRDAPRPRERMARFWL